MLKTIYIVISRDRPEFIHPTFNEEEAENVKLQQVKHEEMAGGRPSVYVKISKITV